MDRETATEIETGSAAVIDFAQGARRVRARLRPEPTPDELLEEFARAVRRTLLADLATWPDAFQRRLRTDIEWQPREGAEFSRAEWLWRRFRTDHQLDDADEAPSRLSGCGCGCRGFNGEVAEKLRKLRTAAAERRGTPTPRMNGRRHIETAKAQLLETLWYYGRRRIDRARLRQHIVESVRLECESGVSRPEADIRARAVRRMIASARRRLRAGVYEKGPRKGQPYSDATRRDVEQELHALLSETKELTRRTIRTPFLGEWLADLAQRHGVALPKAPSDNYLVIYAAEDVESELARVNAEVGLRGRDRLRWPGVVCDWTCNGKRAAIVLGVGTEYPDGLDLACLDWMDEEFNEALSVPERLRVVAARTLRERLKPIVVQDLGDPATARRRWESAGARQIARACGAK